MNFSLFGITISLDKNLNASGKNIALDGSTVESSEQDNSIIQNILNSSLSIDDITIPAWKKNVSGKMLWLNDAYEMYFLNPMGLTKADYVGKNDIHVWGKDVAQEYRLNDLAAIAKKGFLVLKEPITIGKYDLSTKWNVVKFATYNKDREVTGIVGMAIPYISFEDIDRKRINKRINGGFWEDEGIRYQ